MSDPVAQISHVVTELAKRHPSLAYVHVVEPRVDGVTDFKEEVGVVCFRFLSPPRAALIFP